MCKSWRQGVSDPCWRPPAQLDLQAPTSCACCRWQGRECCELSTLISTSGPRLPPRKAMQRTKEVNDRTSKPTEPFHEPSAASQLPRETKVQLAAVRDSFAASTMCWCSLSEERSISTSRFALQVPPPAALISATRLRYATQVSPHAPPGLWALLQSEARSAWREARQKGMTRLLSPKLVASYLSQCMGLLLVQVSTGVEGLGQALTFCSGRNTSTHSKLNRVSRTRSGVAGNATNFFKTFATLRVNLIFAQKWQRKSSKLVVGSICPACSTDFQRRIRLQIPLTPRQLSAENCLRLFFRRRSLASERQTDGLGSHLRTFLHGSTSLDLCVAVQSSLLCFRHTLGQTHVA